MRLDHVFVFCDALSAAEQFEDRGFEVTSGREHPGQGTANRSVLFRDWYLELIYLKRRADAELNPMRLDRRADWAESGWCPFGVGLRGSRPADSRDSFSLYEPPYSAPFDIWVHEGNDTRPRWPLIFFMEGLAPDGAIDASRPSASLTLSGPAFDDSALDALKPPGLHLETGDSYGVRLAVEGSGLGPFQPDPLLRVAPA